MIQTSNLQGILLKYKKVLSWEPKIKAYYGGGCRAPRILYVNATCGMYVHVSLLGVSVQHTLICYWPIQKSQDAPPPKKNFLNTLTVEDGNISCSENSVTNLMMLLNSPKGEYLKYTAAKPEIFTLGVVKTWAQILCQVYPKLVKWWRERYKHHFHDVKPDMYKNQKRTLNQQHKSSKAYRTVKTN
jgi:hypothetical protein